MVKKLLLAAAVLAAATAAVVLLVGVGLFGRHETAGEMVAATRRAAAVQALGVRQEVAARRVGAPPDKQILFGDLHVHTTFSADAFLFSLPPAGGEGAHPPADACDFARFCSALDFWSINDHAEALTPEHWSETVESIRRCNEIGQDTVAFLGWEWTQSGFVPEDHYGHKNVILAHLDDERIPARPIASRHPGQMAAFQRGLIGIFAGGRRGLDAATYFTELGDVAACADDVHVKQLPRDCHEAATKPSDLYRKLDEWGHPSIVIPHGTTWGMYTPQGSSLDKQLVGDMHDPDRQTLIEVYSGHGDSEVFREWSSVVLGVGDAVARCPEPRLDYVPMCWRAGEIIAARCSDAGEDPDECERRASEARGYAANAGAYPHLTVPGATWRDWNDAGQCTDCQQPAFSYRPRGSAQYALAIGNFDEVGGGATPKRFRFGFIASSDNHFARPGTGYKEYRRIGMTESMHRGSEFSGLEATMAGPPREDPAARARPYEPSQFWLGNFRGTDTERVASFLYTGGLVAVHAAGRDREAIWDGLERREVYGTSGPRMLLWFHLLNPPGAAAPLPMGAAVEMETRPIFRVRAVGSFEQLDGCPDDTLATLPKDKLDRLCRGQCYNPSGSRRLITRIDVIRIRPQQSADEDVATLVEDPWRSFDCAPDVTGCMVTFDDPDYQRGGRDTVYYVRAIETPTMAINGDNIRRVNGEWKRCPGPAGAGDDCLGEYEPRAWSSPIFVDYRR